MHATIAAIALPLLLCPVQTSGDAEESTWSALPLPGICRTSPRAPHLVRLDSGRHILMPGEYEDLADEEGQALLPVSNLLGLLQGEASARRLGVRFQASAPPLLVRGAARDVAAVRALVDELERATTGWTVDVRAWITPGASEEGAHPSREAFQRAVGNASPWAAAQVRSGEQCVLGRRDLHPFTADFRVEVAQDSGVAVARPGRYVVGRTLHLRVHRARAGASLHLEGLLDWSELAGMETFECGNVELGIVEQPRLQAVQVAFSGVIDNGGALAVAASGTPLSTSAWTLWVQAVAPAPPPPGALDALDMALLERADEAPPAPAPGGSLQQAGAGFSQPPGLESVSSAAVAQAGDMARSDRAGKPQILWAPGIVLAPTADLALWSEMRSLVAAAESVRLRDATLRVAHGALRVTLPVAEGVHTRVLVAHERTLLSSYRVEVAQESWMPVPMVEPSLDGLALQGRLLEGEWRGGAWSAQSGAIRVLERPQVNVARQQSVERSFHAADLRLASGAKLNALPGEGGAPALELGLELSGKH